jgi:uncharacterized protein
MSKPIYINFPVTNLVKSTEFYLALSFKIDSQMSDNNVSSMVYNKSLIFMLMTHEIFAKFTSKTISDTHQNVAVIVSISMDFKEDVQKFVEIAKTHGGSYYMAEPNKDMEDMMFALEVEDLDGHILEPVYMNYDKFPKQEKEHK